MKSLRIVTLALALAVVAGLAASRPASAAVSFDFFYSNLSHQGSWMVSGSYGRVWQPAVYHPGWNPYYDGHWSYTDAGWCWDSDYAWGDIPYHYGTWVQDSAYGWVWVPGYTWAPSWVEFRQGPDYIGWAPVAPSFSVGVSFHAGFPLPLPGAFVFVHSHDFLCDHVSAYAVPHTQVNMIVNRTRIINNNIRVENNIVVNRGPDVRYVERATHRRIDAIPVDRSPSVRRLDARGISRQDIRVSGGGADRARGLRAAEPVSASRPLPSAQGDRQGRPDHARMDTRGLSDRSGQGRVDTRGPSDRYGHGRMDTPGPSDRPDHGRMDMRGPSDRIDPSGDRRSAPDRGSVPRAGRPDDGRMFRGVQDRQPAPHADRFAPSRERTSPHPLTRSTDRPRSADGTRRTVSRTKVHKDHDKK